MIVRFQTSEITWRRQTDKQTNKQTHTQTNKAIYIVDTFTRAGPPTGNVHIWDALLIQIYLHHIPLLIDILKDIETGSTNYV